MQLKLSSISKKFDHKIILEDTSFTFEQGKIYGLLGRNGAGKTTLFNCIARNLTLDGGSIQFVKEENAFDYDNTDIGFTQTYPQLPAFMTLTSLSVSIWISTRINSNLLVVQKNG